MTEIERVETCDVCGGFGVVTKAVPVDHPDFGKSFPCPACNIAALRKHDSIVRMSNLQHYLSKTFDTFHLDLPWLNEMQAASLQVAFQQAFSYAKTLEGWFLLTGGTGSGKTHLAAAIAHEAVSRSQRTIFATTPDLLDHLRATYSPTSEISYDQQFDQMRNVTLLVIDDFGAESASRWAQEKLYQLINHRYTAKLPTVITTNNDVNQFEDRIASRLLDTGVTVQVPINVPDFRRGALSIKQGDATTELSSLARYEAMTFDSFVISDDDLGLIKDYKTVQRYAHDPEGWLVIVGGYGAGKTHLAAAVANHWQPAHDMQAMMVSTPDLMDYLRATFSPNSSVSLNNRFNEIRNSPLLVLDDLDVDQSAWVNQKLFQLLDYRYLTNLPTVITLNMSRQKMLKDKLPDVHSRLADRQLAQWVILKTDDYRRKRS